MDKLNKSPSGILHNMNPHNAYIITIRVSNMTLSDISKKKDNIAIIQLCQNPNVRIKWWRKEYT